MATKRKPARQRKANQQALPLDVPPGEQRVRALGHAPAFDIDVPQDIIDKATRRNSSHCIVADAVRAHVEMKHPGRYRRFSVDLQTIRFTDVVKNERYTYLSPRSCQICLVNFDQGKKPQPFSFRLRGGQTTRAGLTMDEKARHRAVDAKYRERKQEQEKSFVQSLAVMKKRSAGNGHTVPVKIGGEPPPVSIGLRRTFGMRAFDR